MSNCEVDMVTGEVVHSVIDMALPIPIGLDLKRRYLSSSRKRTILGWGWAHNFTPSATLGESGFSKHDPIGGDVLLAACVCDGDKGPLLSWQPRNGLSEPPQPVRDFANPASWAGRGSRLTVEYPDKSSEAYVAESDAGTRWLLLRRRDALGNALEYQYDANRLAAIERTDQVKVAFEYSLNGLLNGLTVSANPTTSNPLLAIHYEYDRHEDLVAVLDEHGKPWRYEYVDHLLVRSTDYDQHVRIFNYDKSRRCVLSWHECDRRVRHLKMDPIRHNILVADSYGSQTLLRCTKSGTPESHVDPKGYVTQRILDPKGALLATMQADGQVTGTFVLDSGNHTLMESTPIGGLWQRRLDDRGRLIQKTSPMGRTESYQYDAQGRLAKTIQWCGGVLEFKYDQRGEIVALVDPFGHETRREVGANGRLIRFSDKFGVLGEQRLDALANLIVDIDAEGRITEYSYSAIDCPASITGPDGAVDYFQYDASFQMVAHTDALGRTRRYEYDSMGNLAATIDPLGEKISYVYDLEDDVKQIINEKGESLDVYRDALRREVGTKYFDGKTVSYELDPMGRRTAIIDGVGRRTTLLYVGRRDIHRRGFADGAFEVYEMNGDGDYIAINFTPPEKSSEPPRMAQFAYNDNCNLVADVHDGHFIKYDWNLCGKVIAIRDSLGDETYFKRGPRHWIDAVTDVGREYVFRRLATGEISEIEYPNGLTQSFAYDVAGRMIERRMLGRDGRILTWRRFVSDACNQLIEMEDWHWGRLLYDYDSLGRLTEVRAGNGTVLEQYRYDATSNFTECPLLGRCHIGAGNRLTAAGAESLEYDANGNLVARRDESHEWRYEWDRDEQLSAIWKDDVLIASYEYDLINRRTRKITAAGAVEFLYETYSLRAEVFSDGTHNHYLSLPGLPIPIAQRRGSEFYFYGFDHIGTPIEVFNEAGELVLARRSHAFGAAPTEYRPVASDIEIPLGFMGQYFDSESALFYNHFRYYDPRLGRYIAQDPLGTYAGMNFYVYPTNPTNVVDPRGLLTFTCPSHWGACQAWYARQKVAAINNAPASRRKKTCTNCRADAQKSDFTGKKCGRGHDYSGRAIDHFYELQAGGPDRCCANLRAVEATFNGELGSALQKCLKGINPGDAIGKVSMSGCTGKGECSEEGQRNVAKAPPDADACEDDQPLDCTC